MQFGSDTIEGIVALLHAAAIQAAEMRGRLAAIEDILGDEYDLDRLRELAQADREGRIEIIEPDVMECIKTIRKPRPCYGVSRNERVYRTGSCYTCHNRYHGKLQHFFD